MPQSRRPKANASSTPTARPHQSRSGVSVRLPATGGITTSPNPWPLSRGPASCAGGLSAADIGGVVLARRGAIEARWREVVDRVVSGRHERVLEERDARVNEDHDAPPRLSDLRARTREDARRRSVEDPANVRDELVV